MSILDTVARTILQVKVDGVGEAKAQLKSLQGAEKELGQERVAAAESGNKALEGMVKNLGYVGVAIGALKVAWDGFEKMGHRLDLEASAAGISIEKLRVSSKGLKTDMELLEHVAALNTGTFKLNQGQLEVVEQAMYNLEERGKSSTEVWSAMEAALTKGSIKPLQSLGVVIHDTGNLFDENGGKLDTYGKRQQALTEIMAELGKTARGAKDAQLDQADAVQVSLVKLKNYWEQAQEGLGMVIVKLKPVLDGLASAVDQAATLISLLPKGSMGGGLEGLDAVGGLSGGSKGFMSYLNAHLDMFSNNAVSDDVKNALAAREKAKADAERAAGWESYVGGFGGRPSAGGAIGAIEQGFAGMSIGDKWATPAGAFVDAILKKFGEKVKPGTPGQRSVASLVGATSLDRTPGAGGFSTSLGSAADSSYRDAYGAQIGLQGIIDSDNSAREQRLTSDWMARLQAQQSKKTNFLKNTFGEISDFNAYATAFQTLTGAVTTGMNAWIDGSMSAGQAIKKFIGEALKSLAAQMAVEALKHGAYALGSLAFGDIRGASTHAAAAAAFGGAAVAAAVAAKEMGGSASAPAKGGGAGAGASGGGGSGGGGSGGGGKSQGNVFYIAYGDAFAEDSPRQRRLRAEKTVQQALGGAAGSDS